MAELYIICPIDSNWIFYQKDQRPQCLYSIFCFANGLFYPFEFYRMGWRRRIATSENMERFNANLCRWSSILRQQYLCNIPFLGNFILWLLFCKKSIARALKANGVI